MGRPSEAKGAERTPFSPHKVSIVFTTRTVRFHRPYAFIDQVAFSSRTSYGISCQTFFHPTTADNETRATLHAHHSNGIQINEVRENELDGKNVVEHA